MTIRVDITGVFPDPALPIHINFFESRRDDLPYTVPYGVNLTFARHVHDFSEVIFIHRGRAFHHIHDVKFPVSAGDVFVIQGEQDHFFSEPEDLWLENLMFITPRLGPEMKMLNAIPAFSAFFRLEPEIRGVHQFKSHLYLERTKLAHAAGLLDRMRGELTEKRPGYVPLVRGLFLEILVFLSRQYENPRTGEGKVLLKIGTLISRLECEYAKDWSLEEMTETAFMSRSTLGRIFRQATGSSPMDYLLNLRLAAAMKMLRESDRPVSEIALDVGFSDSNYFARQFRDKLKTTPREFRRQGGA